MGGKANDRRGVGLREWLRAGSRLPDERMAELLGTLEKPARDPEAEEALRRETGELARLEEIRRHERALSDRAETWGRTKGLTLLRALYACLAGIVCALVIALLLVTVARLPSFGDGTNPIHNEVSQRYIEKGREETGAVNMVAGMILDYRAFDTLGESHVLFAAVCAVMILLRLPESGGERERLLAESNDRVYEPKHDIPLQRAVGFLCPVILLFGIYILLNGHLGPGGGFSGGAVIGAGLILYLNAFGFAAAERFATLRAFRTVTFAALGFYALSKAYSFFTGANGLESGIGPGTPGAILSAGLIPWLNVAVGLTVAAVMYAFYTLFRKGEF